MDLPRILTIESKADEKVLHTKTRPFDFSKFTKKELRDLIQTMRKTMKAANGIGLSANQIGLDFQMFVAEIPQENKKPKFYAIFNPKIVEKSKEVTLLEEGCLSVPGIYGKVPRHTKVTLKGFDKDQKEITIKAVGLLAHNFQHETDHLNGILFIDKAEQLFKIEPKEK